MSNGNGVNGKVLLDWIWKGFVGLLVPILIFITSAMISIDKRVTAIESSRFTTVNGLEVWQALGERPTRDEVIEELRLMREEITRLREQLSAHDLASR